MPDDRFFHKRAGHSEKVNALTDFEELIWRYYVLSADDFGVMRFDHRAIQNDHERAGAKASKVVQRALDQIRDVELIHVFEHQGRPYCYSRNWQQYQKIDYPRETMLPCPPADELQHCKPDTVELFSLHPGGKRGREKKRLRAEYSPNESQTSSDPFGEDLRLTRAGALAEAKANGNGSSYGSDAREPSAVGDPELGDRAGRFVERYGQLFTTYRKGARYHSKPAMDFQEAIGLCTTWDDVRLETLATAFLTTDDKFCRNGNGSIAQFRSRASWCDARLRERGL